MFACLYDYRMPEFALIGELATAYDEAITTTNVVPTTTIPSQAEPGTATRRHRRMTKPFL